MKTADITPDVSLLKKMASVSGSVSNRLTELVDNAIDARIPGKLLEINITVSKGKHPHIIIEDNGHGMDELALQRFFRLGDSDKKGKKQIGQFGIGSKIAILGLGDSCKVKTTPVDEPYGFEFSFDVNSFTNWNVEYDMHDEVKEKHGTCIRVDNLTIRLGDVDRFCKRIIDHISKTYKHFLKSGEVKICVNKTELFATDVELIPGYYQEFDFVVDGKRVYGWAGAAKNAASGWKFGFDLINNNRIIKSNDMLARQAHTSLSRLVGEVHLDEFPVDIHKTDFIRHNPSFEKMQQRLLQRELASLLTNISRLTSKNLHAEYEESMGELTKSLMKIMRSYDFLRLLDIDDGVLKHLRSQTRNTNLRKPKKDNEITLEEIDELTERLKEKKEKKSTDEQKPVNKGPKRSRTGLMIDEPSVLSLGNEQPAKQWNAIEKEDGVHLAIEINVDHPLFSNEAEIETHVKSAMTESLAEFILREEKRQSTLIEDDVERLNRIKDLLLRHQNA